MPPGSVYELQLAPTPYNTSACLTTGACQNLKKSNPMKKLHQLCTGYRGTY